MHQKRYQVFISSTYQDLQSERRAVQDEVISMGDFPVQMESFPAADEDQFEFIKALIDKCDYYVLIIAGRYGSLSNDGLSYTHKEFRYAVEKGVPVLVFIHGDPNKITADKLEESDGGRARLKEFIKEAESGRLRQVWVTLGELKLVVRQALDYAKATKPRVGWVRGDSIAALDALEELNNVRKENQEFREALGNLSGNISLPVLPDSTDSIVISLSPAPQKSGFAQVVGSHAKVEGSWISFFPLVFSNLHINTGDWNGDYNFWIDYDESCIAIGSAIAGEITSDDTTSLFKISRTSLDRLISYYKEVGLMVLDNEGHSAFTDAAHKVARRFHISESTSQFSVIEGGVLVSNVLDEVPF